MKVSFVLLLGTLNLFISSCVTKTGVSSPVVEPPQTKATESKQLPALVKLEPKRNETEKAPISIQKPEPVIVKTSHPLKYRSLHRNGITLNILSFDASKHHLKVADQTPGRKWNTTKAAVTSLNGIAGINGGFFAPNGKPLGYVRASNEASGNWNTGSSLTSGVYQFSNGKSSLLRNKSANRSADELLQTGPFLLENSKIVNGLSSKNSDQRSLLLWDGHNHFAIVHTSSCTLSNLAKALQSLPSNLPKQTALNLDGGRSCDFYVSSQAYSSPVQRGHWLRSNVRNYLVLVPN